MFAFQELCSMKLRALKSTTTAYSHIFADLSIYNQLPLHILGKKHSVANYFPNNSRNISAATHLSHVSVQPATSRNGQRATSEMISRQVFACLLVSILCWDSER
jgi:hypothetical protein